MALNKHQERIRAIGLRSLDQAKLQEIVFYHSDTGRFTWLHPVQGREVGDEAGCVNVTTGYVLVKIAGVSYAAHRLAWLYVTGSWPSRTVDHRNRDRSDNAWSNLRLATVSQNGANRTLQRNNTSGAKGVYATKTGFAACIRHQKRRYHLGVFSTVEAAGRAYALRAKELFGEFAS